MLINFSVKNWQSFRDKATLNLTATGERQHREQVADFAQLNLHLLPAAAIFGGNASGKTKLFNALGFAKNFITQIMQPQSFIPREPFRLDPYCPNQPSDFSFAIIVADTCYEFSFSVTEKKVFSEKLVKISKNSEMELYRRDQNNQFTFNFKNLKLKNKQEEQRLKFVGEGTRENQLFLTNSVWQNVKVFQPIYAWFQDTLILIGPDTKFIDLQQFTQEDCPFYPAIQEALSVLDTGIAKLSEIDIASENLLLPDAIKAKLMQDLPEGGSLINMDGYIRLMKKNGELLAKKLVSGHKNAMKKDKKEILFDILAESSGTLRLLHLLPCLLTLAQQKQAKVCFIDELDRCLHSLLTRKLLEIYLQSCSKDTRSQLIFTTHDLWQMDQEILRRDEMWFTERELSGNTLLKSFSEYKDIRYDKNLRKSYLQGHFGGIPQID